MNKSLITIFTLLFLSITPSFLFANGCEQKNSDCTAKEKQVVLQNADTSERADVQNNIEEKKWTFNTGLLVLHSDDDTLVLPSIGANYGNWTFDARGVSYKLPNWWQLDHSVSAQWATPNEDSNSDESFIIGSEYSFSRRLVFVVAKGNVKQSISDGFKQSSYMAGLGTFLPIPLVFIIPDYQLQYFNEDAAEFSTAVAKAHWQQHYNVTFLKPFNKNFTMLLQNNWRKLPDEISIKQNKDNWRYQNMLILSYQF